MIKKVLHYVAKFVSVLGIPPILSLILFVYFIDKIQPNLLETYLIIISFFAFLLHIVWVAVLYKLKLIDSWEIEKKEQRKYLFLGSILIYIIGGIVLLVLNLPKLIYIIWLSYIISTSLIFIITLYWKISIHAIGASGSFFIMCFYGNLSMWYMLIPILVLWARVYLRRHTISQVIAGFALGIIIPFILFSLL
ncbi:MAG TPA: hypothetical protein PLI27_01575 [Ignavibacteriales bacterium]|nr:hypothetical protein [Ignavibacteriales bacterium]HOM64712.1 hypothetical protein [Ignavibacteriales bacterium]HPD66756.1 hypothetical protein [Ignavibacteriales bacterium]HPP32757.1 hypothetical protein [Ignavibacteriales bacterium]HRR18141.1 hypothetical protein [Ignavibacteriales bacterium]